MEEYIVGSPVTVFIEDVAADGGPIVDPLGIQLLVRKPDGTLDTYIALTHDAVGAFSYVVTPAAGEEGTWAWRFETTTPNVVKEGVFLATASALLSGDAPGPRTGPCHRWCDEDDVELLGDLPTDLDAELLSTAIEAASDVLFQLGGRRWPGVCDRTVRVGSCNEPMIPLAEFGVVSWHPVGHRFCGGGFAVELPGPIISIDEVRIDGVVLDPASYMVRDYAWLVRTDGASWPCSGRWWEDPAPMEVDYTFGQAPPAMGSMAAAVLARELVLAWTPGSECRLDRRVTSITRENVSMDLVLGGLADALANGGTNIPEVELFVQAHNPHRLRRSARFVGL